MAEKGIHTGRNTDPISSTALQWSRRPRKPADSCNILTGEHLHSNIHSTKIYRVLFSSLKTSFHRRDLTWRAEVLNVMPRGPRAGSMVGKTTEVRYLLTDTVYPGRMGGENTQASTHRCLLGHLAPLVQPPPHQSGGPWCPGSRWCCSCLQRLSSVSM